MFGVNFHTMRFSAFVASVAASSESANSLKSGSKQALADYHSNLQTLTKLCEQAQYFSEQATSQDGETGRILRRNAELLRILCKKDSRW